MKIALFISFALAAAKANTYLPRLTASTALKVHKATLPPGSEQEDKEPFDVPVGYAVRKITDRVKLVNTTTSFPLGFTDWGMTTYAAPEETTPGLFPDAGKFIFIPFDSPAGGLLRYNTADGSIVILAQSNPTAQRNLNPAAPDFNNELFTKIDSATFTPFGTVLFAEDTTGR